MAEAERALAALRTFDADPRPAEVPTADAAAKAARDATAAAELDYAKIHAVGVAWAFFGHLGQLKQQVEKTLKDALDAAAVETDPAKKKALEHEIDRLDARVAQFVREIDESNDAAQTVEADPSPAGDAQKTGSPFVKCWPEFAPDPIRTGEGAGGDPVALRCDGPVGYTFDLETEAGRCDHAGIFVSPVAAKVRPWSLVKLRFRRLEAPELLVDHRGKPIVRPLVVLPTAVDTFERLRLSSINPNPVQFPRTIHEGLVFEVADLQAHCPTGLRFSFDQPETTADGEAFALVSANINTDDPLCPRVVVDAATKLGDAGQWAVDFETGSKVQLRVMVQQRPKPGGDKDYRPAGDASVHVRLVRDTTEALARPHENAWLSVICTPLNARDRVKHDADVALRVRSDTAPTTVAVRPVRLSDFTPGVWCQFAAAMSRVMVDAEIKTAADSRGVRELLPVARLTATKASGGKTLSLGIDHLHRGETVPKIALTAEGESDLDAQVQERLYALVTRYVYDAFDRLRERPIAVHNFTETLSAPVLGDATWPSETLGVPYVNGSGRVRIVRVLLGRIRDGGGFEPVVKEFPRDFFGTESDSLMQEEAPDAAGQVIGISAPFEWSS